jgi:hypothetical protein
VKGPPLAPFVRIPAQIDKIDALRLGDDVFVTVTIPSMNIDMSQPVDIDRVDVYGYTGAAAPPLGRFAEVGDVVASIPVLMPPRVDPDLPPPPPLRPTATHAVPGMAATIRDELTAGERVQGRQLPEAVPLPGATAVTTATAPAVLRRFYVAIPFSSRGVPGPPSRVAEFTFVAAPDPPAGLRATHTETAVRLEWQHAGGLLGALLDRVVAPEPPPFDLLGPAAPPAATSGVPPGPTTFNVYREIGPDPLLSPVAASATTTWGEAGAVPLNPAPLTELTFSEQVQLGRPRCYTVRAVRGGVISPPSPPLCFTPRDVFPPAAPVGLAAVSTAEGISLLWDPNSEPDLGGYLVLRREAGDATLRLLTERPVRDARFQDTTVVSGRRYTYSVIAVDTQLPLANLSPESTPSEETAR